MDTGRACNGEVIDVCVCEHVWPGVGEQSLPEGHARVCWLGKEEIDTDSPFGELEVVDRAFLHGDIVAKAANPLGQVASL